MLRALATWTMISAVRGLATMSSTTLERLVAPRTCCGATVARILLLGDGDLSCSAAVADAATVEVVPTTFESPASLEELYGGDARRRADGLAAVYGVDATAPQALGRFDRVIFNFPHAPGKQNIRRNRELLRAACANVERSLLAPRGELVVALDGGQAGTAPDLRGARDDAARIQAFKASWQLDVAAADAGLLVAESSRFAPFYETRSHRLRRFSPRDARLHCLARDGELAGVEDAPACYTFEVQLFGVDGDVARVSAVAEATSTLVADVRHVDAYVHRDARTSHAFQIALGSRSVALTRDTADAARVAIEAEFDRRFEVRRSKAGHRVSAPRPWVS